jgi:D-glycero-D-manno-heptose 1,7-bisphosphate phosphatase
MTHVVLDRDGTLIRHVPYLSNVERVELLPTVVPGLRALREAGCKLFLHSNQSGIGRGYFSLADALACNEEMLRQIGLGSELFADVCICPEVPGEEISYRKPSPRYGLEVMAKYGIDRSRLCYVGDNISDLLTAKNIGCAGIGVNTGVHDLPTMLHEHDLEHYPVFHSLLSAATHIVDRLRGAHERN